MDGVLLGARFEEPSDIPWNIEILKLLVESLQKRVVPEEHGGKNHQLLSMKF